MQEIFNMAGMELPEYLKGKSADELKKMADEAKARVGTKEDTPKK
ncbi:MAG TPA: hypothetical protein VFE50_12035 [Cyclobacteriaceae bacterium]|nr:hypothetical protein [Cyclobacteriaceae bacterium]